MARRGTIYLTYAELGAILGVADTGDVTYVEGDHGARSISIGVVGPWLPETPDGERADMILVSPFTVTHDDGATITAAPTADLPAQIQAWLDTIDPDELQQAALNRQGPGSRSITPDLLAVLRERAAEAAL